MVVHISVDVALKLCLPLFDVNKLRVNNLLLFNVNSISFEQCLVEINCLKQI